MDELKRIISANIVALRKKNKLTQIDLAKQINYSDKAISRWEIGDVIPDVETLDSLARVFNVSVTYFFEQHKETEIKLLKPSKNQALSQFSVVSIIWTILTIVFVYFIEFRSEVLWQIFVWGVPLTCLSLLILYRKWEMRIVKLVLYSLLCWTTILSLYLSLLKMNLWLIFIIGIPIQLSIITLSLRSKD